MKEVLMLLIGLGLIFSGSVVSYADSFSDTVNFSGSGTFDGRDYLELSGSGSPFILSYNHNMTFNPPAHSITSAEITLSHRNNSATPGEIWFLYQGTSTLIGELGTSTGPNWVDQHFTLPPSLYSSLTGDSWLLQLSLQENTSGTDKVWIDQSVLSGLYTPQPPAPPNPVPEPSTMLLLGSGLVGLWGFRKKRRK